MSKIEEILHKLTTQERNLIKNKIRAKDQQIRSLEEQLKNAIITEHKINDIIFYIAPKRQIRKATIVGLAQDYCFVRCMNRAYLKLEHNSVFKTLQDAQSAVDKYYSDIPKNYERDKLNNVYWKIKERCYNPKCASYHNYGGRGIVMCEEWKNSFQAFRTCHW